MREWQGTAFTELMDSTEIPNSWKYSTMSSGTGAVTFPVPISSVSIYSPKDEGITYLWVV